MLLHVGGNGPLDGDRAVEGAGGGRERRHDAIAGVLNLAAAVRPKRLTHDDVVHPHQLLRLRVAETLPERGGRLHIGEEDGVDVGCRRRR